jgi:hypothetical protein
LFSVKIESKVSDLFSVKIENRIKSDELTNSFMIELAGAEKQPVANNQLFIECPQREA